MASQYKLGKHATTVTKDHDGLKVIYHDTPVVTVKVGGVVILNTGGWFTASTRNRMNQTAYKYNLGYYVFQKGRKWFVRDRNDKVIQFQDGLAIVH